jgi:hypothetical protein
MIDETKLILDTVDDLLANVESEEMTTEHAGQEIANKSEELLRHPTVLNLILNPTKLDSMFERLFASGDAATRQIISNSIERGIKSGLESLRGSRMIYPEAVRCMLNYIKFFDLRRDESIVFDQKGEAIFLFCDTMLGLPFEGYNGEFPCNALTFHWPLSLTLVSPHVPAQHYTTLRSTCTHESCSLAC